MKQSMQIPQLKFSHRQPNEHCRKLFHANLNLSSSTSLKRLSQQKQGRQMKLSNFSDGKESVNTNQRKEKGANKQSQSRDSKESKETVKKQEGYKNKVMNNLKSSMKDNGLKQSLKLGTEKSSKTFGQWIRPKNRRYESKTQIQDKDNTKKVPVNIETTKDDTIEKKRQKSKVNQENLQFIPSIEDFQMLKQNIEKKQQLFDEDEFIKWKDLQVMQNLEFGKLKQTRMNIVNQDRKSSIDASKEEFKQVQQKIGSTITEKKPVINNSNIVISKGDKKRLLKRNNSINSVVSVTHSSKSHDRALENELCKRNTKQAEKAYKLLNYSQKIGNEGKKRDIKYSKFKQEIRYQEQKHRNNENKKMTMSLRDLGKINSKELGKVNLRDSNKIRQKQVEQEKQLLPCHFSYNSPNSYVKKYQELTSTPELFIQSLKQLKLIEEHEQHQYFKYEKNQKKFMYYGKKQQEQKKQQKSKWEGKRRRNSEVQQKRRRGYSLFVEELKNKKLQQSKINTVRFKMNESKIDKNDGKEGKNCQNQLILNGQNQFLIIGPEQIPSEKMGNQNVDNANKKEDKMVQQMNGKNKVPCLLLPIKQYPEKQDQSLFHCPTPTFPSSNSIQRQESAINSQSEIKIMFRKKDQQANRLKKRIDRIRSLENEFLEENRRAEESFWMKRIQRLKEGDRKVEELRKQLSTCIISQKKL